MNFPVAQGHGVFGLKAYPIQSPRLKDEVVAIAHVEIVEIIKTSN